MSGEAVSGARQPGHRGRRIVGAAIGVVAAVGVAFAGLIAWWSPGKPRYFLDRTHPTGLEQDFVVAWWEQRGAGMSYGAGLAQCCLVLDRFAEP